MTGAHRACFLATFIELTVGVGTARTVGAAGTEEEAQQAFREGVEAARQSHWPEARSSFEQAYALSPRPVVLINLAGAQARTGRLLEAARNYHRILDDSTSGETAPFRKAAAEVLPELEQRIPRIRVHATGHSDADTFEIDGESIPPANLPGPVPLDPGQHTLVVSRAGVERARVLFSLAEREEREIPLALPTLALVPTLAAPLNPAGAPLDLGMRAEPEASPERSRHWWTSPWTWGAVGVVVVAATAGFLLFTYEHRERPFSGNVPPGNIVLQ